MMQLKIIRLTTLLDFGGQERKLISFTDNTDTLKHDYQFAAIGYGGEAEQVLRKRGFKVTIFNQNPRIYNLKNIYTLYRWFKTIDPDLVHTAAAEANFHGVIAAKMAGVKIIVAEEIGTPSHSKQARFVFKYVYKLTSKVICVSKAVQNYLIKIGEVTKNQTEVIYNPVSLPERFDKSKNQNFTLITVGRLEPVKNHKLLIAALSKIQDKSIQLIIVGDGTERDNLESLTNKLDLQHRVTFVGFSKEPEKFLARADLFVLPSYSEGFGIAAVEAMFCDVPCLCTNIGGCPELIEDTKSGWLFDPYKLNDLIDRIDYISQLDKEELEQVAIHAKSFALENFTSQQYVETLESFYDSLNNKNV